MAVKQDAFFERIIALAMIALLSVACFRIVSPFVGAILWAVILVVATWPLYLGLDRRLGQRPGRATLLITLALALLILVPVAGLTVSFSEHVASATRVPQDLASLKLSETPPAWVSGIPVFGQRAAALWRQASADMAGAVEIIRPQIREAAKWLISQGANLGLALFEFLLAIAIAAVLYGNGREAAAWARRFALRVGGGRSVGALEIAALTIRGVSLGVVGTAALQAVLSGFGFWLAGVPGVVLLSFFCFFTAMLQIGTGLIWIPVAAWLGFQGEQGWSLFTVGWGLFINIIDNFIKPYLISQGSGLPFALIFLGVIGGLLTWGVIGIFLGPTLLAIGYSLVRNWLEQVEPE